MASVLSKYLSTMSKRFSDRVTNIGMLATSTLIAQIIGVLALPVLTKFYTPDDFSLLAVYMSLVSILTLISALRLNIAIPIVSKSETAKNLLQLSLISATVFFAIFQVTLLLFSDLILKAIDVRSFGSYIWLVPVGVLLASFFETFQYWFNRKQKFKLIARNKIERTVIAVGVQLGLGVIALGPLGLIVGHALYGCYGIIRYAKEIFIRDKINVFKASVSDLRESLRDNRYYPLYSVPEAFFNTCGTHLPLIMVASAAGAQAGLMILAIRVIGVPVSLVGASVSQVFLSEINKKSADGSLEFYLKRTMLRLFKIGFILFLIFGTVIPSLLEMFVGSEWLGIGEVVLWLIPGFFLQFIVSPVSTYLHARKMFFSSMVMQFFGFVIRVFGLYLCIFLGIEELIEVYAILFFLFYAAYFMLIIYKSCTYEAVNKQGGVS